MIVRGFVVFVGCTAVRTKKAHRRILRALYVHTPLGSYAKIKLHRVKQALYCQAAFREFRALQLTPYYVFRQSVVVTDLNL